MTSNASTHEVFPVANPDRPQAACALLLDVSQSMAGARLDGLNEGLAAYRRFLAQDEEARQIVETCVITFGDTAQVVHPFSGVDAMPELSLEADGATALGAAIDLGIQAIEERKAYYKEQGVDYYRPFLVAITDGAPTDMKGAALDDFAAKLSQGVAKKRFNVLVFGTKGAEFKTLKRLVGDSGVVAGIDGARFEEFFRWLSASLSEVKDSKPGQGVAFDDPTSKTEENPNPFAFEV